MSNSGSSKPWTAHLPIIDLSNLTESTSDALLQAAREFGFLYVRFKALPINVEDINSLFDISRRFFVAPIAEKEKYKIGPDDRGWSAPYNETLDEGLDNEPGDFKEAFNIGEFKDHQPRQPLPLALSSQSTFLDSFQEKSRALCLLLLEHLAIALKISPEAGGKDFFSSRHAQANGSTGSILRLLYYPSQTLPDNKSPTESIRCGAHTDFGSMTLLFQRPGQPGLEITSLKGDWLPVTVFPPGTENDAVPPVVVNIGDMLQFWTKGVLRSTKHRVVMPLVDLADRVSAAGDHPSNGTHNRIVGTHDRYSIAYFCHPAANTLLIGVPSRLVEGQKGREYEDEAEIVTAGEHLRQKLEKAYGWAKQT